MRLLTIAITALLLTTFVHAENIMVIMSGQSNMEGRGKAADVPDDLKIPKNVTIYVKGKKLSDEAAKTRFGPELGMAVAIGKARPGDKITICKYAMGGTSMSAWRKDWDPALALVGNDKNHGSLYKNLMDTIKQCRKGQKIIGFCWMQGETDHGKRRPGKEYAKLFTAFIKDLRTDLKVSDMPVVIGRIRNKGKDSEVKSAQVKVAKSDPRIEWVDTDDLDMTDGVHYSGAGDIELGKRMCEALEKLK